MRAVNVKTPAIMCHECTAKIESAVSGLPGVIGVTASLSGGTTSVMFDESQVDRTTIIAQINSVGFDVEDE